MTEKRFEFGINILYINNRRRFSDLEGFLDDDYDGEHHRLWDNLTQSWVTLNEALEIMHKEYGQLKQELFESKKDYLIETYSDNPARRDEKIHGLKEEFKERFGDLE